MTVGFQAAVETFWDPPPQYFYKYLIFEAKVQQLLWCAVKSLQTAVLVGTQLDSSY